MAMRSGLAASHWLFDVDPKFVPAWSSCNFIMRAGLYYAPVRPMRWLTYPNPIT